MPRIALCLIVMFCFVPVVGATTIDANNAGCNGGGGGSCAGPYTLGGPVMTLTFDYSIPNATVKKMTSITDVGVGLGVWDTNNGKDTSLKSFTIELVVGSNVWTLGTSGQITLEGYKSSNRDFITETLLDTAKLEEFLTALKGSKGKFSVAVVADPGFGNFLVGTQDRFATVDYTNPEPASLGMASMGLIALCWSLRRKIRKSA